MALVFALGVADRAASAGESETAGEKLRAVERAVEEARAEEHALHEQATALGREVMELRTELVAAARAAQEREEEISALQARLDELEELEATMTAALTDQHQDLALTLGALQRLSRRPPEALIAMPASFVDTIRTGLLLKAVVPELEGRARSLRIELAALAGVHQQVTAERERLTATAAALTEERKRIEALLRRKAGLQKRTLDEHSQALARVSKLVEEVGTLRELLERLRMSAAPPIPSQKPPPGGGALTSRSFTAARGTLALPARGRVTVLYGEPREDETMSKGIVIATLPGAQVVATYDGQVVFAGRFREYGQLLIIEHGQGYHSILAGLSRIDSVLGQWLLAGEPVGVMSRGTNGNPTLYVELRRNGQPINPLPWLAAGNKKVSG